MIKTVHDNEHDLRKKGTFYRTNSGQAFKCKKGNHYYWMNNETFGEWLKRIINCL